MDMFDYVEEFWIRSLEGTMIDFEFEKFFSNYEGYLWHRLAQHGYLSVNDYVDTNEFDRGHIDSLPDWVTIHNPWISLTKSEIFDTIIELQMEVLRKQLPSEFDILKDLYDRLIVRDYDPLNPEDLKILTALVDECIHAQHTSGFIVPEFDQVDMDDLRDTIEKQDRDWVIISYD